MNLIQGASNAYIAYSYSSSFRLGPQALVHNESCGDATPVVFEYCFPNCNKNRFAVLLLMRLVTLVDMEVVADVSFRIFSIRIHVRNRCLNELKVEETCVD